MDSLDVLDVTGSSINGLNLYAYCLNNPVMYFDPSGQFPLLVFGLAFLIGTLAGGVSSIVSQGATKGWDNIDFGVVGIDAVFGGLNGLLMASGVGIVGQIALGGTLSMFNYMATQTYQGKEITDVGVLLSFGVGSIAGALRGNGLMYGKYNFINRLEKTVVKTFMRDGFSAGVKSFGTHLGRHFVSNLGNQMLLSGIYGALGKVGSNWGRSIWDYLF